MDNNGVMWMHDYMIFKKFSYIQSLHLLKVA